MSSELDPKALEAAARAHDAEDAAQKGEPSPWRDDIGGQDEEWKAERIVSMQAAITAYLAALPDQRGEIERLREALKPFALLSDEFDETWSDTDQLVVEFDEHGEGGNGFTIHRFNVGDARRAAALLRTADRDAVQPKEQP